MWIRVDFVVWRKSAGIPSAGSRLRPCGGQGGFYVRAALPISVTPAGLHMSNRDFVRHFIQKKMDGRIATYAKSASIVGVLLQFIYLHFLMVEA